VVGENVHLSTEGHLWTLTIMGNAKWCFIAVPMKKIDSVSVAQALMTEFSIFGILKCYSSHGICIEAECNTVQYTILKVTV